MFCIEKNGRITLTKGDTATIFVEIYDIDDKQYEIQDTDVIIMTVKKNASDSDAVFIKTADEDHYFIINSSETAELDCGLYVYDIQLKTEDDYTYTITPTNYFRLTSEVSA